MVVLFTIVVITSSIVVAPLKNLASVPVSTVAMDAVDIIGISRTFAPFVLVVVHHVVLVQKPLYALLIVIT